MEEDVVVFPLHIQQSCLPEELIRFFSENSIPLNSSNFSLSFLRTLYTTDNERFRRIKYLLEAFGFNIYSKKGTSYFAPAITTPVHVVEGGPKGNFYPMEISELGLMDFVKFVGSTNHDCMRGVVIERVTDKIPFFLKYFELQGYKVSERALFDGVETEAQRDVNAVQTNNITIESDPPAQFVTKNPTGSQNKDNKLCIDNAIAGLSIPYFCLRFFTEIISCGTEIQNAYVENGFSTFGDLIGIAANDIPKMVSSFSAATKDNYLSGIAEENLISFCQAKEKFEASYPGHELKSAFLYSPDCPFAREDVLSFNLGKNDPLRYSFDSPLFGFSQINNQITTYLSLFGIHDLSFLTSLILSVPLATMGLSSDYYWCRLLFHPFGIFEEIATELGVYQVANPYLIDNELRLLDINKDFSAYRKKIDSLEKGHIEILRYRESGMTLEEIGALKGVTRERIRQIAAKTTLRIVVPGVNVINRLIRICEYVPLEVFQFHPGLVSIIENKNQDYPFFLDEDLGIVSLKRNQSSVLAIKEKYKRHSGRIGCSEINQDYVETGLCLYGWLTDESDHLEYDPYPIFIPKLANLHQVGAAYLKTKGMKGYHVNNDMDEAMRYFEQHAPGSTSIGYRAISSDILRSGTVLRGMSRYISKDLVKPEQIKVVGLVLNGLTFTPYGLTGQAIFEAHSDLLKLNGVDNPYFVYGIASAFYKESFSFNGRGLRIFKGDVLSLDEMAEAYINENGHPFVKEAEFKQALGLGPTALEQCNVVTKFDKSTIILKSWFTVCREDYEHLENVISNCISRHGYCHCSEIISSQLFFDQEQNHFLQINRLNTPTRIAYFFDVMCERLNIRKYHVSHHCDCISLASDPVETKVDLLRKHFKGKNFTKKQAEDVLHSYKLTGIVSGNEFYKGWAIFLDKDHLMLKEDLTVTDEEVTAISDALTAKFEEDIFITAKQAVAWLIIKGAPHKFTKSEIGTASVLTANTNSKWACPQNDLAMPTNHPLELLANKRFFGDQSPSYSCVIKTYVFSELAGQYVTYDDVIKLLKDSELIDVQLTFSLFAQIFEGHLDGQLLEVPE